MEIRLGLPHEKEGGRTLVLFGNPRIMLGNKHGHRIYVDCHVIISSCDSESRKDSPSYEIIFPEKIPAGSMRKMHSFAKKLAENHPVVKKRGWKIRSEIFRGFNNKDGLGSLYVQNRMICAFLFTAPGYGKKGK